MKTKSSQTNGGVTYCAVPSNFQKNHECIGNSLHKLYRMSQVTSKRNQRYFSLENYRLSVIFRLEERISKFRQRRNQITRAE